ncbi:MAG TPA: hypothetical protein VFG83_17170 [Kofleriaceae bacterium]|nr:hypothetical protein [Kofleriaceae bacterium]
MLTVYLVALAVGGTLLVASLVFGGDHDHDPGLDDVDGAMAWLPFASLRFWIFFATFFGLTGSLLSWVSAAAVLTAILAIAIGAGSGWAMVASLRRLGRGEANSAVGSEDLVGCEAEVIIPVAKDKTGKVRAQVKSRRVNLVARTEDAVPFEKAELVMIYAIDDNGCAMITRAEKEASA